ncbi:SDR family NAD(P)-dependent oxidoreductase [Microlunatus speluncae]|uniref:SDR family NAD(P)-dependent oxidoreductase n=1 Tax=Microlunatus speluncae TaxID=2594267 RepID=UPI001266469C|nr:SDR family NAD(P)-dependent oxidoreductase [Microlunatus speluncae]
MTLFTGRTAVVTGASRGLGRAVAGALAAAGADLVLVARDAEALLRVAAELQDHGVGVRTVPADLSLPGAPDAVADAVGAADLLINNAAVVTPIDASRRLPSAAVAEAVAINLTAPMILGFRMLGSMIDNGWGRIVGISSGVAARPDAMIGGNVYGTGKAALEAHLANLAAELAGTGVTANTYRPGMIDTGMQAWIRDQGGTAVQRSLRERFVAAHRDGRLRPPEEVAAVLVRRLATADNGAVWDVADG